MILLLDENLSPRLVDRLASLFPGIKHVRDIGLKQASDEQIWQTAKDQGYTVVTADTDFLVLSRRFGSPPKVVHIKDCDVPFRVIEALLRQQALAIVQFHRDPTIGVLTIPSKRRRRRRR